MMTGERKPNSLGVIKVNATFVIKGMGRDSYFTISGTLREGLRGEMMNTITEFTRKYGLMASNFYSSAPNAIMPLNVLKDMDLRNIEDYSEQSGCRDSNG